MTNEYADQIVAARRKLFETLPGAERGDNAAEGGCGVLGFAANIPVAGRHVLTASRQMHNRGNGKGGGIAMVGLDARQAGVDAATLRSHYILQIALLDNAARGEVESQFITPYFDVAQSYPLEHLDDSREIPGLAVQPPEVQRYFVRVKPESLARFGEQNGLQNLPARAVEDEFIYQNSTRLNRQFYTSLGEKRAFVASHGRNLSVLKIVGYAEDVVAYYCLENQTAHVWIAHQRYPTKGRVWHPGGAHPFIGLNEALVHNGDFANYHAVSEYLHQRNIGQLFLTDTEVSVQLFDLWDRVYGYPLEITLEAMAPTTEFDFEMLPDEKKALYRAVQRTHIHGSPDGPWFFIVARSKLGDDVASASRSPEDRFELLGITDTSMLRPQVFALYENLAAGQPVQIGLIASERQAINACLRSLAAEDARFQGQADRYWAARGGSYTDGGAFRFSVNASQSAEQSEPMHLVCANKFGQPVRIDPAQSHLDPAQLDSEQAAPGFQAEWARAALDAYDNGGPGAFWNWLRPQVPALSWNEMAWGVNWLADFAAQGAVEWDFSLQALNQMHDRRYPAGEKKRASLLAIIDRGLTHLFEIPQPGLLMIDAEHFPPEGDESAARRIVQAYEQGWRRMIVYNGRGGRFAGCGLGPETDGLQLDLYGDVGDYAASGLDGATVVLHGDGQDQLGQILKRGKLVIHGDAGQTFLYGAKGGEVYVLGSAAGRPLINAVGKPRVVINGTCLDYLAESFMAGDPLNGGGFVIVNGVAYDEAGELHELETPYPGGNLFSLASGGAIYLRDPHQRVAVDQLNGGVFEPLSPVDWELIEPYLLENERLFDITLDELLTVEGVRRSPADVYRKVDVAGKSVLRDE